MQRESILRNYCHLNSGGKFFFLKPNDIVYVPKTWIRKAAEIAKDIGDILFFKGWGLSGRIFIDDTGTLQFLGDYRND